MKFPGLALAAAGAAFTGAYYAAHRAGAPAWGTDALLVLPALMAAVLLWRRGDVPGAARWHWRLLSVGAGVWAVGAALWAGLQLAGRAAVGGQAWQLPLPVPLEAFFVSFLGPMLAAITLGPKPIRARRDPLGAADAALASVLVAFLFARAVLLPRMGGLRASLPSLLLAAETLLLSCWAFARARRAAHGSQRWPYACVGLFALSYGLLGSRAHGWAGEWSPAATPLDVAWILPFFLLAAATLPARGLEPRPLPPAALLLLAGPLPLLADLVLDRLLPGAAGEHQAHLALILPFSALLAVGAALRLHLGEHAGRRAAAAWRAKVEEAGRAARLSALASMSSAMVARLRRAVEEVVRCADAAGPSFPRRAAQVLEHARGAETIVSTMEAALLPLQTETRSVIDLAPLLEESVQVALETEAPLEVRLEGLAALDPVVGDPVALRTAFLHLVSNAAQASPGGVLHIRAEREGEDLVLRFIDDGPGVPRAIEGRIFDPFFTTGPPGEAVGLGLTLVHAVARQHRGSIVLEPGTGRGATFALRLPALRPHPGALPHWGAVAAATASAVAGAGLFGALSGDLRALVVVGSASALVWAVYALTSRRRLKRSRCQQPVA